VRVMVSTESGAEGRNLQFCQILGNIDGAKSFEDLLRQAWQSSQSQEDLKERIEGIGEILEKARDEYSVVRDSNQILDDALEE